MTRQSHREAAAAVLAALDTGGLRLAAVFDHAIRTLDGRSPIATVTSAGLAVEGTTRGGGATLSDARLLVSLYVRADPGGEAAAEDRLDALAEAAALALAAARFDVGASDASPGGGILTNYDGTLYRVERFPISRGG